VGEKETEPFQFTFNGFLKVAFQGSRVTSDAGLILVRELDERLGLEAIIAAHLSDSAPRTEHAVPVEGSPAAIDLQPPGGLRRPQRCRPSLDRSDVSADRITKRWDRSAAQTSTLHWFETELLTREENLVGLMAVNRDVIGQAEMVGPLRPRRARHGFQREPVAWAARRQRLQRPLRDGLLSPAVPVQ
jgi:hypothetical protein